MPGQSTGCLLYNNNTRKKDAIKRYNSTQCENSTNFPWNNIQISNGAMHHDHCKISSSLVVLSIRLAVVAPPKRSL